MEPNSVHPDVQRRPLAGWAVLIISYSYYDHEAGRFNRPPARPGVRISAKREVSFPKDRFVAGLKKASMIGIVFELKTVHAVEAGAGDLSPGRVSEENGRPVQDGNC